MVGAVQFGILVACVVLFVPMGMAGWHLSRNKMLFFSGALFITLAVGVHLTPYIPSVSVFLSSIPSLSSPDSGESCLSFLNDVIWEEHERGPNSSRRSWNWDRSSPVAACGFQRLGRVDASDLLNGSWIVVAGDSQARLFALSLLRLVLDSAKMEAVQRDLFKRHSDYRMADEEHGMKLDFIWAPYESNLTDLLIGFREPRRYPDVLVMGTGMWHMLHVNNASDYGRLLAAVKTSALSLLPVMAESGTDWPVAGSVSSPQQPSHMFWLGMPTLVSSKLNTEEKREKMSRPMWEAYLRELNESQLLRQRGGGPLLLLDIGSLSRNCGQECAEDGMHYDEAVYEAGIHIMLNALLIVSHQHV